MRPGIRYQSCSASQTIIYRQDNPVARIAIVVACVTVICALLIYAVGLIDIIGVAESARETMPRRVVAAVVALIFFPPAFLLVRFLTPKQEVAFEGSALIIKSSRDETSIAYAEVGSMVLNQITSRRLDLYDHAGRLLYSFRTGTDKAALESIVSLIGERISFEARREGRVIRFVRTPAVQKRANDGPPSPAQ